MKKLLIALFLFGALPFGANAQDDDMYFVPTKENSAREAENYGIPKNTYYSGSKRSIDDYNRKAMWSSVSAIDSTGNDIIEFSAVRGVYPDSITNEPAGEDYQLTRRMERFDDYTPSEAYWDGYRDGRWSSPWYGYSSWYWNDPWYWRSSWYWNDPWYYSGYYGWYSPWYYGYGYRPWYYTYRPYYGGIWYGGGSVRRTNNGRPANNRPSLNGRNFGGYRSNSTRPSNNTSDSRNTSFGGNRSYTPSSTSSGSSFGGSHSSGGGSSMGGGRSTSGGRSFGGRR